MDENLSRGYTLLDRHKSKPLSTRQRSTESTSTSPSDDYNLIYLSLLLAGVGFLLPYNSFVIAVDYFQSRYPSTTIIFDISSIYIFMAFLTVIINNVLVDVIPLFWRINFGYGLSFLVLVFVTVYEICAQLGGYQLNLIAVAIVAVGCTVQQSSFYGYTSMLPKRYTHSVMIGESMAGIIVSANRIFTKLILPNDEKLNTMLFFSASIGIVVICGIIHSFILPKTRFVQFYINNCNSNESDFVKIANNEGLGLVDMIKSNEQQFGDSKFGVLSIDTEDYCKLNSESSGRASKTSQRTSKLLSETDQMSPIFTQRQASLISRSDSTDFVLPFGIDDEELSIEENYFENWLSILKSGYISRFEVSKLIWPHMLSITIAYLVTLSLFPGIESEIISCKLGSWMPVILMAVFNLTDFIGKLTASLWYRIGSFKLVLFSCLRILIIPLLSLCAAPRYQPFFKNHLWSYSLSAILGITNGIFGSLPMILAPMHVSDNMKELTGNIMTFSYSIGLTSGSLVSYAINYMLGPNIIDINIYCINGSDIDLVKSY